MWTELDGKNEQLKSLNGLDAAVGKPARSAGTNDMAALIKAAQDIKKQAVLAQLEVRELPPDF